MRVPFGEGKIVSKPWEKSYGLRWSTNTLGFEEDTFQGWFSLKPASHQFKSETNFVLWVRADFKFGQKNSTRAVLEGAMPQRA